MSPSGFGPYFSGEPLLGQLTLFAGVQALQFLLDVDGFTAGWTTLGVLDPIPTYTHGYDETAYRRALFSEGKARTLVCSVRRSGSR